MKKARALVYTGGYFTLVNGKSTHGLLRHSDRFEITGVIDEPHAGMDAGVLLDGVHRNVPVYGTFPDAMEDQEEKPEYLILGIATPGGKMPGEIKEVMYLALKEGMKVVNCLHELFSGDEEAVRLAGRNGGEIIDLRKSKPFDELHFFSGDILSVKAPRIAFLGTDCALGKRTTAVLLIEELASRGVHAELVYTGQTGWLQGFGYGLILDATPNDFVSGELEHEVARCDRETHPDLILIEGQSSLRNPSGPCGSEILLSCMAKGTVLQHAPRRMFYEPLGGFPWPIPPLKDEIKLVEMYGSEVIAVSLYEGGMDRERELSEWKRYYRGELGRPVVAPVSDGADELAEIAIQFMEEHKK